MSRPPTYRGALPGPLAAVRRRALLAWQSRPAPATVQMGGFDLLFEAGLPDPRPVLGFSMAAFLLDGLAVRAGERLLDLATGAGLTALWAGRIGAEVVAVDRGEAAARCLRRSSLIAGLGEPDVRIGGLDAVAGEQFDVITWLPPLVLEERSVVTNVLNAAPSLLRRGGRLVLPFADRDGVPWLHDAFAAAGLRFSAVRYADAPVLGPVRLYRAWPARHGPPGEVAAGDALSGTAWVLKDR